MPETKSHQEIKFFDCIEGAKIAIERKDADNLSMYCTSLAKLIWNMELFDDETTVYKIMLQTAANLGGLEMFDLAKKAVNCAYIRGLVEFDEILFHEDFTYDSENK